MLGPPQARIATVQMHNPATAIHWCGRYTLCLASARPHCDRALPPGKTQIAQHLHQLCWRTVCNMFPGSPVLDHPAVVQRTTAGPWLANKGASARPTESWFIPITFLCVIQRKHPLQSEQFSLDCARGLCASPINFSATNNCRDLQLRQSPRHTNKCLVLLHTTRLCARLVLEVRRIS